MDRYRLLEAEVDALARRGLRRHLRVVVPDGPVRGTVDGRRAVLFSTNDYLGLTELPELRAAWVGAGAASSRVVAGHRPEHAALEEELGVLFGRPATLFASGYHANLALLTTLLGSGDLVASDAQNHASLIDGIRLSGARRAILPHGEPPAADLAPKLTVVEGLYSMDGDIPDLRRYGRGWLYVDEAHAVGVRGPNGTGTAAEQGVEADFLMGTLGKAYGAAGAFVVGPPVLRELLLSAARTQLYTTALAPAAAAAARVGLRLATDERREQLADNVRLFRRWLAEAGVRAMGDGQIVSVVLGEATMAAAEAMLEQGIHVPGIRYPTVEKGKERLRFSLTAAHGREDLERAVAALAAVLRGASGEGRC